MYFYYRWPCSHTGLAVAKHDSPVGDVITVNVDPEYSHCFLKAYKEGEFTNDDIALNKIFDVYNEAPKFVADHAGILSQKRKLAPEVRCLRLLCFPLLTMRSDARL
jgi:hypothetical protein